MSLAEAVAHIELATHVSSWSDNSYRTPTVATHVSSWSGKSYITPTVATQVSSWSGN